MGDRDHKGNGAVRRRAASRGGAKDLPAGDPRAGDLSATPLDRALARLRPTVLAVAGFSLAINLLMLVSPLYMMQVFDRVLGSGHAETLLWLTVIAGIALLCLGALETVRGRLLSRAAAWLDGRMAGWLIAGGHAGGLAGRSLGTQPLRDLEQLRGFLGGTGMNPIFDAPWAPVFIAVIWMLHPWLGLLALGSAILLFLLALANELATRGPLKTAGRQRMAALTRCGAALRNAEVVQALGLLPRIVRRWEGDAAPAATAQQTASDVGSLILGTTRFVRLFVQVGILGIGAYLVLQGQLTSGGMIAGSILLGRALAPFEQAVSAWKGFVGARASYHRLQTLLRAAPAPQRTMALPPVRGRVTVEAASFVPPGSDRPVLRQVGFALEPGEALAVIGPSASGKSTLCRLLVGVWPPSAGHVRLDGADVTSYGREELGRQIGYLPQDVELFDGTVRDNIARLADPPDGTASDETASDEAASDESASDESVIEAAMRAGAHDLILHLPQGYDTRVGEGGAILSGGQRQRIALARALYGRPRLLVLDEPAASLDQEGEAALMAALATAKEDGTTIVLVAHRPSQLAQTDRILVLRQGAVEQFGPRDEILQRVTGPRPVPSTAPAAPQTAPVRSHAS